jgi:hypothetical protein
VFVCECVYIWKNEREKKRMRVGGEKDRNGGRGRYMAVGKFSFCAGCVMCIEIFFDSKML